MWINYGDTAVNMDKVSKIWVSGGTIGSRIMLEVGDDRFSIALFNTLQEALLVYDDILIALKKGKKMYVLEDEDEA